MDRTEQRGMLGWPGLNGAEDAGGEGEEGSDELEDATDDDADEAEGEKDQPDEGVEDQREERCGPADDQEDQEEEKLHGGCLSLGDTQRVGWWFRVLGGFGFAGQGLVDEHLEVGLVFEAALLG